MAEIETVLGVEVYVSDTGYLVIKQRPDYEDEQAIVIHPSLIDRFLKLAAQVVKDE